MSTVYKGILKKWQDSANDWDVLYPKTTIDQVIDLSTALSNIQTDVDEHALHHPAPTNRDTRNQVAGTYLTEHQSLANYLTLSGKAADSELADGLVVTPAASRNDIANQIVTTNVSGYATFGWINTTSGNTTGTVTDIYVNTNDGYIRKKTLALMKTELGIPSTFAPTNAQAHVAPTKAEIESVLTGYISSHNHDGRYIKEGGTSFNGTYPVAFRIDSNNFYSDSSITFTGSTSLLTVAGDIKSNGYSVLTENSDIDAQKLSQTITTVTTSTHSYSFKRNSTVIVNSSSPLSIYLDNMSENSSYDWQVGDTLTVIRLGSGYVRIYDSCGSVYVSNEGTPVIGGLIYLPKYTAVTCMIIGGTDSSTNWIVLGATSTDSTVS